MILLLLNCYSTKNTAIKRKRKEDIRFDNLTKTYIGQYEHLMRELVTKMYLLLRVW